MKKYVVTCEEDVVVICKTRADAEEYIFSEVEEIAYEYFLEDARYGDDYWTPNSFFNCVRHNFESENNWRMTFKYLHQFKNLYAYILNCNVCGWHIHEVEELD